MNIYHRFLIFPILLTSFVLISLGLDPAYAQNPVSGAGSTSTNFEKIGMGARAAGMGGSFTGLSDDASAIFWNPAGLVLSRGTQFSLTHGEWLLGVTHEFFCFSQNLESSGALGGSFGYLDSGTFPGALEDASGNYAGVGPNISAQNYIGTVGYAQRIGNWVSGDFFKRFLVGLTATVVGQNVVNIGNAGVAFNLGIMDEVVRKTCYVGGVLKNAGTSIQDFSQPLAFKFGGSYQLKDTFMKKDRDIVDLDFNGQIDTGIKIGLGDEYKMTFGRNDVFLRLGYSTEDDLSGLTAGAGILHRFDDFDAGLDYAYVPYGVLGDTHRITLKMIIGGVLMKPEAYAAADPAFILGHQNVNVRFATKSDEGIDHYKVNIVDSGGTQVKTFEGHGNPPSHFLWDGRNQTGELVPQGEYDIDLEVTDDNDLSGTAKPAQTYAKWVPKRVPYQYTFQVPGDMLFDSGKADLMPRGYEAIQKAALAIRRRYPDSVILIAGHTDNQKLAQGAKFKDNQELSLARAKAVMNYLVQNGMDPSKLSVVGYGETKPIASNSTKEGMAKNRRVELVVSGVMDVMATDLIDEGMIMFKQGNYREALDRFLKAIESDSRNAKAYHLAGDCYLRLAGKEQAGKELAYEAYRKSLKFNPGDTALQQWMDQYGPKTAPAPAAPVSNTAPAPQPGATPQSDQGAAALETQPSSQPQTTQPATAPAPSTGSEPASQTAPPGVPQPVEAN